MFSNPSAGMACQREQRECPANVAARDKQLVLFPELFATSSELYKGMGCMWQVKADAKTTRPPVQSRYQPRLESRTIEPGILSGLLCNRSSSTATVQTMGHKGDPKQRAGQRRAWIREGNKSSFQDDLPDNADAEAINRSNSLASDGAQSSRSVTSGSTLVGSTDNDTPLAIRVAAQGQVCLDAAMADRKHSRTRPPDKAQAQAQAQAQAAAAATVTVTVTDGHGPQPVGSTHQPSLFQRCLGTRRRPSPPVLVFVLRRHPRFAGVLEVVDCDDMTVAYRKIARETQRPWRETFHEVADHPARVDSNLAPPSASFAQRKDSMCAGPASIGRYAASRGSLSFAASTSSVSSCSSAREWAGRQELFQSAWRQALGRHPHAFDLSQLWEISSPNPDVFPMHCRDARGVIDPVPLASMVLDRHQFCFRFQLCGNRMRWQVASKEERGRRLQLQCFVRSTIVALLFFTISAQQPNDGLAHGPDSSHQAADDDGWLQQLLGGKRARRAGAPTLRAESADGTQRMTLPSVVILPAAFGKMPGVEAAVVESFVLFTGIEVLERFVAAG
ncbi:hypothetical protein GGF39_002366 [Coemansia sp. RSA 1721]|nr:hypothetical protein GGF39_002366 [Coemansia sp. RSA 1721]